MTTFYQFNGTVFVPSTWTMPDTVAGGETGEVLSSYGPNAATFETPPDNLLLYRNAATTLDNPWLAQWASANGHSSADNAGYAVALRNGSLKWMRGSHSNPDPLVDELLTYVIVVNGIDTALAIAINVNQTGPILNSTDTVAVNAGDLISMRCDGLTATRGVRAGINFFLD
jgi:hypothetical protein